jgi:hypothetical protein
VESFKFRSPENDDWQIGFVVKDVLGAIDYLYAKEVYGPFTLVMGRYWIAFLLAIYVAPNVTAERLVQAAKRGGLRPLKDRLEFIEMIRAVLINPSKSDDGYAVELVKNGKAFTFTVDKPVMLTKEQLQDSLRDLTALPVDIASENLRRQFAGE